MQRSLLTLALIALTVPAFAGNTLVLTQDGTTVAAPTALAASATVTIEIDGADARYEILVKGVGGPNQPFVLDETAGHATPVAGVPGRFTVQLSDAFTVYNVRRRENAPLSAEELMRVRTGIATRTAALSTLNERVSALPVSVALRDSIAAIEAHAKELEKTREKLTTQVTTIDADIATLTATLDSYKGVAHADAIAELRRIHHRLEELRAQKRMLTTQLAELDTDPQLEALQQRRKALEDEQRAAPLFTEYEQAKTALADLQRQVDCCGTRKVTLLAMGVLVAGPHRKIVYYGVEDVADPAQPLNLVRITEYPVITTEDDVYAIIANVVEGKHPTAFKLTVDTTAGSPINIEPLRPTFPPSETAEVTPGGAIETTLDTSAAHRDVLLPFPKRFDAFAKPKVTIQARLRVVTDDQETVANKETTTTKTTKVQLVTLVDGAEYPPVRGLYRFNLVGGLMYSALRDRSFTKVQTQIDNPDTPANEQRFRIDELEGNRKVRPTMGLTYYWRPVDVTEHVTLHEALIPNPTIAFGVSDPVDNAFLGFTHSVTRNVQIVWGLHRGKRKELEVRDEVTEQMQATAPPTRDVNDTAMFVGLSFNLNVVGKLLSLP